MDKLEFLPEEVSLATSRRGYYAASRPLNSSGPTRKIT